MNLKDVLLEEHSKAQCNRIVAYIGADRKKFAILMDLFLMFALTVLQNLSKDYPEISAELKYIIQDRWEHETPAFHQRAKRILKKL